MKGTLRPGRKAGVLALVVLLLTCVLMAGAVSADEVRVYTYEQLSDNITGATVDRTITIADNISVAGGSWIPINQGQNITLMTDGHDRTISRTGQTTSSGTGMFTLSGGNLTIQGSDSSKLILDGNCTNYPSNGQTLVWIGSSKSTFMLKTGGALINNNVTGTGSTGGDKNSGAVYVDVGTFVMEGGEISGNSAVGNGGGVYVNTHGAFVMECGEISGNSAKRGGGVYIGSGTFTMSGGEISNNQITGASVTDGGGGVYIGDGTFVMEGGDISGNSANRGGGVYVNTQSIQSTFTMSDGTISDNEASKDGGGVYLLSGYSASSTFVMEGGAISGNSADSDGGGVYMGSRSTFTMSDGTISGNSADSDGGGVYGSGSTFTMSDGMISGNSAVSDGGGVYLEFCTFEMSKNGRVDGVYLSDSTITVTSDLTGDSPQVRNIDLNNLNDGTEVVTFSGVSGEDYVSYFTLAESVGQKVLTYQTDALVLTQAYKVTFDATGGTPTPSPVLVAVNTPVSKPTDPTMAGYTFTGWYTAQSTKWDFVTPVTEDMILYAGWKKDEPQPTPTPVPPSGGSSGDGNMENAFRVLFNDGAATLSVVTDLSYGDKLTNPETPVKDGYTFAGWYKDSACTQAWDFETGIPGDMTLYAKWTAAGSSGETEATATPTAIAVTTPQPTKTQTAAATTSAPEATTAAGTSPTLVQTPAPVAGALFGLLAAGVLLRRRFQ